MSKSDHYLSEYNKYLTLRNYSLQTIKSYNKSVLKFFEFATYHRDKKLSPEHYARDFLLTRHNQGNSWNTVNIDYSALVLFFKHGLRIPWDYEMTPRPKIPKSLPVVLSHEEISALINSITNIKHQTIVITLYATGLRISELLNLEIEDIDSNRRLIRVNSGKGGKDRIVHVSAKLIKILNAYMIQYYPQTYLFNGISKGQKYSSSSVTKIIKRAALKAGIRKVVSPHTFRHCYATHHLEFGTDLVYINRQLGHSRINMTARYLHLCQHREKHIVHPIDHLPLHLRMPII